MGLSPFKKGDFESDHYQAANLESSLYDGSPSLKAIPGIRQEAER